MTLKQFDHWRKTGTGFLIIALVELGLAYLFGSSAVNSGSLWQWTLTFVLLVGGVSNLVQIFLEYKIERRI